MKLTDNALVVAEKVIANFRNGNLTRAISQTVTIERKPSAKWSIGNQIAMIVQGTHDARGFNQWGEVGRKVKKGAKAIYILAPNTFKVRSADGDPEKDRTVTTGFRAMPVFACEDTEGDELPEDSAAKQYIEQLPASLLGVAEAWGIKVTFFNVADEGCRGYYIPSRDTIGLGVLNPDTLAHELIHAAEDRLGNLTKRGQDVDQEVVAQFGACVLCHLLGVEPNEGKTLDYVQMYTEKTTEETYSHIMSLINRVMAAINLITETIGAEEPALAA